MEPWALLLFIFVLFCFIDAVNILLTIISPIICLDSFYGCLLGIYCVNKGKTIGLLTSLVGQLGTFREPALRLRSTESSLRVIRDTLLEIQVQPGKVRLGWRLPLIPSDSKSKAALWITTQSCIQLWDWPGRSRRHKPGCPPKKRIPFHTFVKSDIGDQGWCRGQAWAAGKETRTRPSAF